jgi:hypothetical protein
VLEADRIRAALQIAAERALGAHSLPIVSLGSTCYTAYLLQGSGIKHASYPFDWIFSSPRMVADCLDEDFAKFLHREFYEPVPLERRRDGPDVNICDHTVYRDVFGVPFVFNHRNPCEAGDYAYFERCVRRFRTLVRERPVVLLHITHAGPEVALDLESFEILSHAVRAYAPQARLLHITVYQDSGTCVPKSQVLRDRDGHTFIEFRAGSAWQALAFANPLDDMAALALAIGAANET